MANKSMMLVTLGLGYLLGARAGRERYDAIAAKARELWQDPRMQETAERAQTAVREKVGQKLPGSGGSGSPVSVRSTEAGPGATS